MSEYGPNRAGDLAWMRGCVPENLCWDECYHAAREALEEGADDDDRAMLDEHDRRWPTRVPLRTSTSASWSVLSLSSGRKDKGDNMTTRSETPACPFCGSTDVRPGDTPDVYIHDNCPGPSL